MAKKSVNMWKIKGFNNAMWTKVRFGSLKHAS
jgi:hypothetical protein